MKKFTGFIAGLSAGILLASAPIFADSYSRLVDVLVNFTTVQINGTNVESDNFVVDGKTYVWIRDVADMFGKSINWDEETQTANIVDVYETIATVDGRTITKDSVVSSALIQSGGMAYGEIYQSALEAEIESAVLLNEAEKNGFTVTDETTAAANSYIQQIKANYGSSFSSELSAYNYTEDSYLKYIEKSLVLDEFVNNLLSNHNFDENELQKFYEDSADMFTTVTAKHILIKTEDRTDEEAKAEADKIMKELLKSPKKFDELMAKYSEDEGSKDNTEGMIFGKNEMVPEFEAASFTQEIGVIGSPVKTDFGYHIILVTERSVEPLENVEDYCKNTLFNSWFEIQIKQWRDESNIIIDEEILDELKNS